MSESNLEQLHDHWLALYRQVVDAGFKPDDVAEAMLTVAIATRTEIDGRQHLARRLWAIAAFVAGGALSSGESATSELRH